MRFGRRHLLGCAVSAPIVSAAVGLAATPSTAQAAPLPLTPADPVDTFDSGDLVLAHAAQAMPLEMLTLGADGVYRLQMPRLDSGTGIATALAMRIAEEAGVTLDKVDVVSADAQPGLVSNQ